MVLFSTLSSRRKEISARGESNFSELINLARDESNHDNGPPGNSLDDALGAAIPTANQKQRDNRKRSINEMEYNPLQIELLSSKMYVQ